MKKQKILRRVTGLTLASVMAMSGFAYADIPEWLNTDGSMPIVAEGEEQTLHMAILMDTASGNPEDMWFFKYIEEVMNINLVVDKYTSENQSEYLSLLFADGDLPDIILGKQVITTAELVSYGAEGMILDMAPYINEENMPNLSAIYAENPGYKSAVTDSEGHVWSLGYINNPADRGQIPRGFLNYDWLEEAGLEVPETLDDFINMLRAFKERGEDIIPLGGSYSANNPCLTILNAFGYNTTDPKGLSIGLRNGEVVLPVADREAYGAYLTTMNQIYSEGLMDEDFFTTDATTVNAIFAEDRVGVMAQAPFVFTTNFASWWGALPLTSEYNETQFWPQSSSSISAGCMVVSADCENPELAMAFADFFYNRENYEMATAGPNTSMPDEYMFGLEGYYVDKETKNQVFQDVINNPDLYASKNDFVYKKVALFGWQTIGLGSQNSLVVHQSLCGWPEEEIDSGYPDPATYEGDVPFYKTMTDGEISFRLGLQETLAKYVVEGYPASVYLDEETAEEALNLLTGLKEYAEQESAKFITGARPLSELDDYFDQMDALGAQDYVKIYADYYASMQQ
ncbi:MAG: extracellular solute-binding protein [Lachnospiraceae bacterium]|nr:extracellular solute-binding protein [Lachnospiraceae bacterium]